MERPGSQRWTASDVARLLGLVEAERRYFDELVTLLPVPLATIAANGAIVSANHSFLREFGIGRDALDGHSLAALTGMTDFPKTLSQTGETRLSTRSYIVRLTPISRWESEQAEWSAIVLPTPEALPPAAEGDKDFAANAAAVRASQRLAARVAHEANNLAMIAAGCGREIAAQLAADSPLRDDMALLLDATQRVEEMAAQLSEFSLPLRGNPSPHRLKDVLPEEPYKLPPAIPDAMVQVDREALQLAWASLAEGAAGSLEIAIDGGEAILAIRGLPFSAQAFAERLEPFNPAARRGEAGARSAVLLGPRLLQAGARWKFVEPADFEIRLPLAPELKRVALVVDDEKGIRNIVRRILEPEGFETLEAASAEEALALLDSRSEGVDLLITDIRMGRMTGRELADRARRSHPGMRILFISGFTGDPAMEEGVLPDRALFLSKPFNPDGLAAAVAKLMS